MTSEEMVLGRNGAGIREATSSPIRPMFLLADSQLLFFRDEGGLFLERVLAAVDAKPAEPVRAAYLGASNGDVPEFYDIFVAAMEGAGVRACRMIPSSPSAEDRAFSRRGPGHPARGRRRGARLPRVPGERPRRAHHRPLRGGRRADRHLRGRDAARDARVDGAGQDLRNLPARADAGRRARRAGVDGALGGRRGDGGRGARHRHPARRGRRDPRGPLRRAGAQGPGRRSPRRRGWCGGRCSTRARAGRRSSSVAPADLTPPAPLSLGGEVCASSTAAWDRRSSAGAARGSAPRPSATPRASR